MPYALSKKFNHQRTLTARFHSTKRYRAARMDQHPIALNVVICWFRVSAGTVVGHHEANARLNNKPRTDNTMGKDKTFELPSMSSLPDQAECRSGQSKLEF